MDRILIIDGLEENLDLLTKRLISYDYEIITADSGESGFTKAKLFLPDLVILDTELPDESGFDTCKKIKEHDETKLSLVLMMSAVESKDTNTRAFSVGADDFVEKSSDSIILLSKVKSLLRVSRLIKQLGVNYLELQEKDKILDFQLKMGRQVQRSLITDFDLNFNDVSLKSRYMPALDIGGDFYDIAQLTDDHIGIVMGDVSGYGISAALLTAMLSMMYRNIAKKYLNPSEMLFHMNNQFYSVFENTESEMYACVVYIVIDTKEKKIHYSNAGHPLPKYCNFETTSIIELDNSGIPIGIMKNSIYETSNLEYKQGDLMLFYTDGLSDNNYKDNHEEFSKKLCETLIDVAPLKSADEIINIILNIFYNFNASNSEKLAFDDVSIILCQL